MFVAILCLGLLWPTIIVPVTIQPGMTQAQVEAILGKPNLPNGGLSAAFRWVTYECWNITVFYSNGDGKVCKVTCD
jgi:hypothetical protein